jgi:hypothetical protein
MCGKVPPSVQVRMHAASIAAGIVASHPNSDITHTFAESFNLAHGMILGNVKEADMDKPAPNESSLSMRAESTALHRELRAETYLGIMAKAGETDRFNFLQTRTDIALKVHSAEAKYVLQTYGGYGVHDLCAMTTIQLRRLCGTPDAVIEIQEALQRHGLGLSMTKQDLSYWVRHGRREIDSTTSEPEEKAPRGTADEQNQLKATAAARAE